ncbi:UNVERIFIED_CONTAM: hypothetical protein GTU68_011233 [Idotea baltica]|nr:hypothetical protein [Idotea baltica]
MNPLSTGSSHILYPPAEGPVKVNLNNIPSLEVQEQSHEELEPGGRFRPSECLSRHKVAIIIPFRDRATHLAVFLHNLLPFLERQQIDFAIFIVEQAGSEAVARTTAFHFSLHVHLTIIPWQIDPQSLTSPEVSSRTPCLDPEQPRHMSVAINNMKYKLPYNDIFGGVSAMTVKQFETVNGFSNKFWGWGGEDDDMSNRIKFHGYFISRYPANVARYTMMPHKKDHPNPQR